MKKIIKFYVDDRLLDDLTEISKNHHISISKIIRTILEEYINTYKENNYKDDE
ncbi:MAG: ribbon-helix-helix protein, CopG family [archaeon]